MDSIRTLKTALAIVAFTGAAAWAQSNDFARLTTNYAAWAGGKTNAEALVAGLRDGRTVTLVTNIPGEGISLAGFTPAAPMGYGAIESLLSSAQRSLQRAGVQRPTAEQIQAALIGGDIAVAGRTVSMPGLVALGGGAPAPTLASR
jgi:hypothetical protein